MSKGAVSQVIERAIGDAAFRRELQGDANKALAGFDLTTDERSAILSGDPGRLTALGVDQRMSKAFNLSGISASKSTVSPELSGADAASLIDEGATSTPASAIVGDTWPRTMSASGHVIDQGYVSGTEADAANLKSATAFEPVNLAGSANQLDPGFVTSDRRAADTAADAVATPPSGPTTVSADGHAITE